MNTNSSEKTPHSKSLIAGRFFVDPQLLGRGGTSDVYAATDIDNSEKDRFCVAKLLCADRASQQTIQRFHQESEMMCDLSLACVTEVFDAGDLDQPFVHGGIRYVSYQILEHMLGGGLDGFLRDYQKTCADKVAMMHKIAKAVAHIHTAGIIHRDLKPSNILLDEAENPKLADFGIATAVQRPSELTYTGEIPGTPRYLSPEQASGNIGDVCYASDVFSLGILFYELLAGVHPFHADLPEEVRAAIISREPDLLHWISPQVDHCLNAIVMKCLEKRPERRYFDAGELAEDLSRYVQGQRVHAPVHGVRRQAIRWSKRHPYWTGLAAAVIVLVGSFLHGIWVREELRHSLRQEYQARAAITQQSKKSGQRIETLKAIEKSVALYRTSQVPQPLVDQAITALTTTDAVVSRQWELDQVGFSISPCFRFRAQVFQKEIIVSRLNNEDIVCHLPLEGLQPLRTSFSHSGKFLLVSCLEKISATGDKQILRIWNTETGASLQSDHDSINSRVYALHPHQEIVAYFTPDHYLQILNLSDNKWQGRYLINDSISHLCFHPSQNQIALSGHGFVHILDYEASKQWSYPIARREGDALGDICWNPDGSLLALALDEIVVLIDAESGAQRGVLTGHKGRVQRVVFANRSPLLASYSWDKTMRLWNTETQHFVLGGFGCDALQFSPNDSHLAGLYKDGHVGIWEIKTPQSHQAFGHHRGSIRDWFNVTSGPHGLWASSGPDGAYVFTSGSLGSAKRLTSQPTSMCLFHPDGTGLFSTHRGMIYFWPIKVVGDDGKSAIQFGPPALHKIDHLDFSRISIDQAGLQLAIASQGAGLQLLSLSEKDACRDIDISSKHHLVTLSPDANWAATTDVNGLKTSVWSTREATSVESIDVESGSPLFSPDGSVLLTAQQNEYVFWNAGTWEPLQRIPCQSAQPRVGAFADHVPLIALIDEDRIQLYTSEDYRPLLSLQVPDHQPIQAIHFGEDGRSLAVTTQGGAIHLWMIDSLIEELQQLGISPQRLSSLSQLFAKQPDTVDSLTIATFQEGAASSYPPAWVIPGNRKKWLWEQAKAYYHAKQWSESAALFEDYLEEYPDKWLAHLFRGGALARLGRWHEAKNSYRHVIGMGRQKARARDWHSLALLQLRDGDHTSYLTTCHDVVELFHQHNNHSDVANVFQTCLLAPNCGYDFRVLHQQASNLNGKITGPEWKAFLIGALQYRSGAFQQSYDTLQSLRKQYPDHENPSARLFLAMACLRLDRRDEAQALVQQTDNWMSNLSKRPAYWGVWEEWLLLRKEMRTLQSTISLPQTVTSP